MGKYYRERGKAVQEGKLPSKEREREINRDKMFARIQGAQVVARKWGCPKCGKGPVSLQSVKPPPGQRITSEPTYHCGGCGMRGALEDLIVYGALKAATESKEAVDQLKENEKLKPNEAISPDAFAKAIGGEKMTPEEAAEWKKKHGVAP